MFNNRNLCYNSNSVLKDFYVRYRYKVKQHRRNLCHKKRSFKITSPLIFPSTVRLPFTIPKK